MADFGYDITHHTDVDPLFGDLTTLDTLLEQAHQHDLKVIVDFVPNHTSEEHPWFLASRSSRQNPKRDWYVWADPKHDGSPPNNWLSVMGGSAWEWDTSTDQYYLRDNPPNSSLKQVLLKPMGDYDSQMHVYDNGHADVHAVFRELRHVLDQYNTIQPRMLMGEVYILDRQVWASYYGADLNVRPCNGTAALTLASVHPMLSRGYLSLLTPCNSM